MEVTVRDGRVWIARVANPVSISVFLIVSTDDSAVLVDPVLDKGAVVLAVAVPVLAQKPANAPKTASAQCSNHRCNSIAGLGVSK